METDTASQRVEICQNQAIGNNFIKC